ncbi:putative transcriptional repressor protein trfb [Burkholderia latens]|uniref:TrfB-related DNA-binding protein n=1 Tax=Burkholderia latens TaxID=488446 RepID=UPI0039A437E0
MQKMTAKEFARLLPKLGTRNFSNEAIEIARRVLVDGEAQSHVARDSGVSRQRISSIVQRVTAAGHAVPSTWERVEVWLPPEVAERVRREAAELLEASRADRG